MKHGRYLGYKQLIVSCDNFFTVGQNFDNQDLNFFSFSQQLWPQATSIQTQKFRFIQINHRARFIDESRYFRGNIVSFYIVTDQIAHVVGIGKNTDVPGANTNVFWKI
jgi:hypothetical protein